MDQSDEILRVLNLTRRNVESIIYMLPSIGNRVDRQSLENWLKEVNRVIAHVEKGV